MFFSSWGGWPKHTIHLLLLRPQIVARWSKGLPASGPALCFAQSVCYICGRAELQILLSQLVRRDEWDSFCGLWSIKFKRGSEEASNEVSFITLFLTLFLVCCKNKKKTTLGCDCEQLYPAVTSASSLPVVHCVCLHFARVCGVVAWTGSITSLVPCQVIGVISFMMPRHFTPKVGRRRLYNSWKAVITW